MAITVIKPSEMGNHASFGQELGQSLGTGFQQGLHGLAQMKLGQLLSRHQQQQKQQQRQAFSDMGFSPQQIAFIEQFPQEQWQKLLGPQLYPGTGSQEGNQPIDQLMGQQQTKQPTMQELLGQQPQNAIMQNLGKLLEQQPGQQQGQQTPVAQPQQGSAPRTEFGAYETPQMKLQRELAVNKEKSTGQRHIDRLNQPFLESVYKSADEARAQDTALDAMDELGKQPGKLNSAAWETILERFGVNKGGLFSSPESELYRALSSSFMGGAKNDIGGRVAVQEMRQYLKRIPSLLNSPEGRENISKNLRIVNSGRKLKEDISNRLIEQNGGDIPKNIRGEVNKLYDKEIEGIRKELVNSLKSSISPKKLPSPSSVPRGTILDNHETKKSVKNTGSGWKSIPYRGA